MKPRLIAYVLYLLYLEAILIQLPLWLVR
ncbi:hypothetical protein KL86DES1_21109 [uncultured Desulfovibrio sp.]|uniref:Uncharacterized protein n=1 Tax=uncultured Desulfovibrio sp. TaxID=167968 RepID=A0A212L6I6_9BACT|nr:hypothetical protein KL86DES1_21109 [uncultured Desulfovibrio sp.]VZH34007.1 conserved protein of unknown function [Desulfovibrio sp. 86]